MKDYREIIDQYTNVKPISQSNDEGIIYTTYSAKDRETGRKLILKETYAKKKGIYERLVKQWNKHVCKINNMYEVYKEFLEGTQKILLVEMEYIEGDTLAEFIKKHGVLTLEDAVDLAIQICEGLEFLHNNGIMHKDLSVSNIMVTDSFQAKIIDFGYSRMEDKSKKYETTNIYTYGSTAPEVTAGEKVDKRADIYSLGKIINFMLVGETYGIKYNGKYKMKRIIKKCTEIKPKDRYKDVKKLKKDLMKMRLHVLTKRKSTVKLAISIAVAFVVGFVTCLICDNLPQTDTGNSMSEMEYYGDLWNDIYYDMDLTKDYDDAMSKIEVVMSNGVKGENVSVCYAKCLIETGKYDKAADILITYLKDEYKYPNMNSETKESYVLLKSFESKVSQQKLKEIDQLKSNVSTYIAKWKETTDKFKNDDYRGALERINELFEQGMNLDIAYFLKAECLLRMNEDAQAKSVYNDYLEAKENCEENDFVEYDTLSYQYGRKLRDKLYGESN